jgi:hypothetical protein
MAKPIPRNLPDFATWLQDVQGIDPSTLSPVKLKEWRGIFDEVRSPAAEAELMRHHCFDYGMEYYAAARSAFLAQLSIVAANTFHHAIEFFLKAHLYRHKAEWGHDLEVLWRAFRTYASDPKLTEFDGVIAELNKFEHIRYPDNAAKYYGSMAILHSPTRASRGTAEGAGETFHLCLEDIDRLVMAIFAAASRYPRLGRLSPEAKAVIQRDNVCASDWLDP